MTSESNDMIPEFAVKELIADHLSVQQAFR